MASSSFDTVLTELLTQITSTIHEHGPVSLLYLHIVLAALFPIYTGAHASLSRPSSAAKAIKEQGEDIEDDEEETTQVMEGLSASDAIVFPLTAGLVLATLYWLIKRYGADVINLIMSWYFAGAGIISVAKLCTDALQLCLSFVFPAYYEDKRQLFEVKQKARKVISAKEKDTERLSPLPGRLGRITLSKTICSHLWSLRSTPKQKYVLEAYVKSLVDVKNDFTVVDFLSLLVGLIAVAYNNLIAKPWWLTNLQGFAVSYFALQLLSPTSFVIGSLVLSGLFFYDIWAVFFTPLMVTVATNLDQPIKLLFPRPDAESTQRAYSMLGLGDIVLPGLMVALALRFDLFMYYTKKQSMNKSQTDETKKAAYTSVKGHWGSRYWTTGLAKDLLPPVLVNASFPKPYFAAALFGYVLGMVATLTVMSVFQHAQPALLYLVPAVLSSTWGVAALRGELADMWAYTEEVTGEAVDDDKTNSSSSKVVNADAQTWWTLITSIVSPASDGREATEGIKSKGDGGASVETKTVESSPVKTIATADHDAVLNLLIKIKA